MRTRRRAGWEAGAPARPVLLAALLAATAPGAVVAQEEPVLVSPGLPDEHALIEGACPTFSWALAAGATRYELEVRDEQGRPVLQKAIRGPADAWSPVRSECLETGRRYSWSVRGVTSKGKGEWAASLYFEPFALPMPMLAAPEIRDRNPGTGESSREVATGSEAAQSPHRQAPSAEGALPVFESALSAENDGDTGEHLGLEATGFLGSHGLAARNTAGGFDLMLDGSVDGETDTWIHQGTVERSSNSLEFFRFLNTGSGSMELQVDGTPVSTRFLLSSDIEDNSVQGVDILADSLEGGFLPNDTISGSKILPDAFNGLNIENGSLTGREIDTHSVSSAKIVDGSISASDIADDEVSGGKFVDRSLDIVDISVGSFDGDFNPALSIADGDCLVLNNVITGSSSAGDLTLVIPADNLPVGWVLQGMEVTAVNSARIRFCNFSGAAQDPPRIDYYLIVLDAT